MSLRRNQRNQNVSGCGIIAKFKRIMKMLSSNSVQKWNIFNWGMIRRLKRHNRCLKIYNRLLWGSTSEGILQVASKGRLGIKRKGDFRWVTNKDLANGQ